MSENNLADSIIFQTDNSQDLELTNLDANQIFQRIYPLSLGVNTVLLKKLIDEYLKYKEQFKALNKLLENQSLIQNSLNSINDEMSTFQKNEKNTFSQQLISYLNNQKFITLYYNEKQDSNYRCKIQSQAAQIANLQDELNQRKTQTLTQFQKFSELMKELIQNSKQILTNENILSSPKVCQNDILQYKMNINKIKKEAYLVHSQWQEFVDYIQQQHKSLEYKKKKP